MDELAAVKASQAGERDAFGILIDKHYKNIYRYAYHCTGNHQDADDICQETFLRAYNRIGQLKNVNCFREWIYTIASNLSRRRIKKIKLNKNYVAFSSDSFNQRQDDKNVHPFDNITKSEKASIIQNHLKEMSERLRMVTVLVLMEDLAQKEAAKILNRSEPSISRDVNDAKAWLQSRLQNLI
ncbi:MAG: RNA polymerase sigma factor [Sedimentisphaerales bacterium]|nr:RNA polymerase sigma factor [Sedimentisphaerales bacterium]